MSLNNILCVHEDVEDMGKKGHILRWAEGDATGNATNVATVKKSNSAQVSIFLFPGSALVLNYCSSTYVSNKISTRTM